MAGQVIQTAACSPGERVRLAATRRKCVSLLGCVLFNLISVGDFFEKGHCFGAGVLAFVANGISCPECNNRDSSPGKIAFTCRRRKVHPRMQATLKPLTTTKRDLIMVLPIFTYSGTIASGLSLLPLASIIRNEAFIGFLYRVQWRGSASSRIKFGPAPVSITESAGLVDARVNPTEACTRKFANEVERA